MKVSTGFCCLEPAFVTKTDFSYIILAYIARIDVRIADAPINPIIISILEKLFHIGENARKFEILRGIVRKSA